MNTTIASSAESGGGITDAGAALRRWAPAIFSAVALAVFANGMFSAFVFDDHLCVLPPLEDSKGALWPPWVSIYGYPFENCWDRPVAAYTHALSYRLSGMDESWGFHVVSLVTHVLCALAMFGFVRAMLRLDGLREKYGRAADGIAFAATLIWLVHPIATVTTIYITQRAQTLMALFYLLTLYCSLRAFESSSKGWWYAAAGVACFLGMGSKQDMASAPFAVLLLDAALVSGSFGAALRRHLALYLMLIPALLFLGVILVFGGMPVHVEEMAECLHTRWEFARTQYGNILLYMRIAVWPAETSFQHFRPVADGLWGVWLPLAVMLALGAWAAWGAWTRRWGGVLGLTCFMALAPSSSFMTTGEIADERRFLLPMALLLGVIVAEAWSRLNGLRERMKWSPLAWRAATMLPVALMVLAYATVTHRRNTLFDGEDKLWKSVVATYPEHPLSHFNYGVALDRQKRYGEAKKLYYDALKINPQHISTHMCLSTLLLQENQIEEAWKSLEIAMTSPMVRKAGTMYLRCTATLLSLGRYEEAERYARQGLDLDYEYPELHCNLGLACLAQGRLDEAAEHLEFALRLDPKFAEALGNLGRVRLRQGRLEEALAYFDEALRLRPYLDWVHAAFAEARGRVILREANRHTKDGWEACLQGRHEEGLRDLYLALRLMPEHPEARHYLSVMKRKAEEDFMAGEAESPRVLSAVAVLANTSAIEGDYEDAAKFGAAALKHARAGRDPERVRAWETRLAGFARGEAYPLAEVAQGHAPPRP